MDIKNYLTRIGVTGNIKNSLEDLAQIQENHVTHIPFENLDIIQGIPLSFDINHLYQKIVNHQRGGVCYELNGLFHFFLQELGFAVSMRAATVYLNGSWFKQGSHLTNIVCLNEVYYLVDVGFGGNTPSKPIPLTGEEIHILNAYYRVKPFREEPDTLILEKKEDADWTMLYKFPQVERKIDDFKTVCEFTQYSKDSSFNKVPVMMKVTERGRVTLRDRSLTILDGMHKKKQIIDTEKIKEIYKDVFGLEV